MRAIFHLPNVALPIVFPGSSHLQSGTPQTLGVLVAEGPTVAEIVIEGEEVTEPEAEAVLEVLGVTEIETIPVEDTEGLIATMDYIEADALLDPDKALANAELVADVEAVIVAETEGIITPLGDTDEDSEDDADVQRFHARIRPRTSCTA